MHTSFIAETREKVKFHKIPNFQLNAESSKASLLSALLKYTKRAQNINGMSVLMSKIMEIKKLKKELYLQ